MGWLQTCLQLVVWSCWIVDAGCRFSLGSSRGSESWSQNQIETRDGERLPSESYMNTASTVQLVRKEGYPIEEHQVTTQDGYQLTLHRIPSRNKNAPVVYLQHGFLAASDFWVITPRDQSLATIAIAEDQQVAVTRCLHMIRLWIVSRDKSSVGRHRWGSRRFGELLDPDCGGTASGAGYRGRNIHGADQLTIPTQQHYRDVYRLVGDMSADPSINTPISVRRAGIHVVCSPPSTKKPVPLKHR
uniref:Partial AB-hydrolase lipase domain-containing protein n=1 Tax=Timema monikensis TaxID=170555 RepID=A0A7R9E1B4_9NEOP|nr:unnamed protein product [Timema monikensis]